METKHFVLTYMDSDQDISATYATYEGEFEEFPVKVSYWHDRYLILPSHFETKSAAMEYVNAVNGRKPASFCLVQERHYARGDPRIAVAKIILKGFPSDFYIQPSRGEIRERYGDPVIDVWTMYIRGPELAKQYVNAFNADVSAVAERMGIK
jgi:hypothetical protein